MLIRQNNGTHRRHQTYTLLLIAISCTCTVCTLYGVGCRYTVRIIRPSFEHKNFRFSSLSFYDGYYVSFTQSQVRTWNNIIIARQQNSQHTLTHNFEHPINGLIASCHCINSESHLFAIELLLFRNGLLVVKKE